MGATDDNSFHWLFRSRIQHYRLQTTVFRKVMFRILQKFVRIRHSKTENARSAFALYDEFIEEGVSALHKKTAGSNKDTEYDNFVEEHLLKLISLLGEPLTHYLTGEGVG